jgi:RNA polymerase sigma-70 factor (ECF subfamily)
MRRFAYGLTGSLEAAEDLVQEACARLLHQPDEKSSYLDRWLFRTIRNLHVDQIRKKAVAEKANDGGLDGNVDLETLQELDQVGSAITRLPEEQRTVIILIGIEGFSYRETAEILGVPVGTVTSRLARARRQLVGLISIRAFTEDIAGEVTS